MRDFKEVPSLQQALEDVSPSLRGAAVLGKSGRSCQEELPGRPRPQSRVLPQGGFCGHFPLAKQQHSVTDTLRCRDNTAWVSNPLPAFSPSALLAGGSPFPPTRSTPSPRSGGPSSAYERGAQESLTFPCLYLERPDFKPGRYQRRMRDLKAEAD